MITTSLVLIAYITFYVHFLQVKWCWNNVYRTVFGMNKCESVKSMQFSVAYLISLDAKKRLNFLLVQAIVVFLLFHHA